VPSRSSVLIPGSGLFNTGVDNSGNALGTPGSVNTDTHYKLISGPVTPGPATTGTIPGGYVLDTSAYRWIGRPPIGTSGPGSPPLYDYQTTFFISSLFNAATASLTGEWAADNSGDKIVLNAPPLTVSGTVDPRNVTLLPPNHGFE